MIRCLIKFVEDWLSKRSFSSIGSLPLSLLINGSSVSAYLGKFQEIWNYLSPFWGAKEVHNCMQAPLFWAWRLPSLRQCVILLLQFRLLLFVPESPQAQNSSRQNTMKYIRRSLWRSSRRRAGSSQNLLAGTANNLPFNVPRLVCQHCWKCYYIILITAYLR